MTVEQSSTSVQEPEDLSQIIKIDKAKVRSHLHDLVRRTVQETLNEMLDAEVVKSAQKGTRRRAQKGTRRRAQKGAT